MQLVSLTIAAAVLTSASCDKSADTTVPHPAEMPEHPSWRAKGDTELLEFHRRQADDIIEHCKQWLYHNVFKGSTVFARALADAQCHVVLREMEGMDPRSDIVFVVLFGYYGMTAYNEPFIRVQAVNTARDTNIINIVVSKDHEGSGLVRYERSILHRDPEYWVSDDPPIELCSWEELRAKAAADGTVTIKKGVPIPLSFEPECTLCFGLERPDGKMSAFVIASRADFRRRNGPVSQPGE